MQVLYNILAIVIVIAAIPMFCWRLFREEGFGERLKQSFGFLPSQELSKVAEKECIWIHAASVGETVAASPLVKEIKKQLPDIPILVTVVTSTGYSMAKKIIPQADSILYFPLDLPGLSSYVINKIKPRVYIPVETELWPNCLRTMRSLGIPVMLANGRISNKSMNHYRYLRSLLTDMLETVASFCMQSSLDAEHVIRLGAKPDKVVVTGNTKFDQTYNQITVEERQQIINSLGIVGQKPVIIAGSTHPGEEKLIYDAFQEVKKEYQDAVLILAPRAILRADEIKILAEDYKFRVKLRTDADSAESADVVILNTIGELGKIYSVGDIIFVGGSLIPQGGHNILEPAAHGKPILVGPYMDNFRETFALLNSRGACMTVQDKEFGKIILELLQQPVLRKKMSTEAVNIITENQGAAVNTVRYLKELLAKE